MSKAKSNIIEDNLKLIDYVIRREYPHLGYSHYSDVKQEGVLGLYLALDNFDPDKGAFSTIAYYHIKSKIQRYIQGNFDLIHYSHGVAESFPWEMLELYRERIVGSPEDLIQEDPLLDIRFDIRSSLDGVEYYIYNQYFLGGYGKLVISKRLGYSMRKMAAKIEVINKKLAEYLEVKKFRRVKKRDFRSKYQTRYIFSQSPYMINKRLEEQKSKELSMRFKGCSTLLGQDQKIRDIYNSVIAPASYMARSLGKKTVL